MAFDRNRVCILTGDKVRLTEGMGVRSPRGANVRDGVVIRVDGENIMVSLPGLRVDGEPVVCHRYGNEMEIYR